jgi:hypothetical protein
MVSIILPRSHRDTLEVLFVFLKWVASFAHMDEETGSKMDLDNLATVICPSILYSRARDAVRDDQFGAIRVVSALLEHQDEFFAVPEEFLPILGDQEYFSNALDLPGKDFLKKCDTYMRLRSNGRTPVTTPSMGGQPLNSTPRFQQPNPQSSPLPTPTPDLSRTARQPHPNTSQSQPYPSSGPPRNDSEWISRPPNVPNMPPSPRPMPKLNEDLQQQNPYSQNGFERRQ